MKKNLLWTFTLCILFCNSRISSQTFDKQSLSTLDSLLNIYQKKQDSSRVQQINEAKIKVAKQNFGAEDSSYAKILDEVAIFYAQNGKLRQAEQLFVEAKNIRTKTLGKTNPQTLTSAVNIGNLYDKMARYEEAIALIKESLKATETLKKNPIIEASLLTALGEVYRHLGDFPEAIKQHRQALVLRKAAQGTEGELYAQSLNNLSGVYFGMGLYEDAEALMIENKKIKEKRSGKNNPTYAGTLNNLALLYMRMGKYEQALALYIEAQNIYKKMNAPIGLNEARLLTNIGNLLTILERYDEAFVYLKKSLEARKSLLGENHPDYAISLSNLGSLYIEQKKFAEAIPLLKAVADINLKKFGRQSNIYAVALSSLAQIHTGLENYDEAERMLKEASTISLAVSGTKHPYLSEIWYNYANLKFQQKNYSEAEQLIKKALQANSNLPDSSASTFSVEELKSLSNARFLSNKAAINPLKLLLQIFINKQDKNAKEQAFELCKTAVAILNEFRASAPASEDKLYLLKQSSFFAEQGISITLALTNESKKQGYYQGQVFAFMEQNKSILLAESLKSKKHFSFGGIPDSIIAKTDAINKQIEGLKKQIAEALQQEQKATLMSKLSDVTIEKEQLQQKIQKAYPDYQKIQKSEWNDSLNNLVQKNLLKEDLMISYFVADSQLYVLAISSQQTTIKTVNISKALLEKKVASMRRVLSDYDFIKDKQKEAYDLYVDVGHWCYKNLLLPSISAHDANIKQLIIVADGELGHLPFETFLTAEVKGTVTYDNLPYLLNKYKVSYNYSATLWKENVAQAPKAPNGKILAFAAAYTGKEDSLRTRSNRAPHLRNLRDALQDLPAAKQEVEAISKFLSGTFLYKEIANERNFKEKADKYSVIHLAMHGLLNPTTPILSSLAFTENGDSIEDNFLEAWEISQMKLNAELVVLSACETGYGKFQQGEGVMSLARSFMYAGVPSMVVSLWQVNDASTSAIMQFFYKNLAKGMDKAEALRQAKLEYIKTVGGGRDAINRVPTTTITAAAAHPAYWAAFIQIGDSRPLKIVPKNSGLLYWAIGAIGLLALCGAVYVLRSRKK